MWNWIHWHKYCNLLLLGWFMPNSQDDSQPNHRTHPKIWCFHHRGFSKQKHVYIRMESVIDGPGNKHTHYIHVTYTCFPLLSCSSMEHTKPLCCLFDGTHQNWGQLEKNYLCWNVFSTSTGLVFGTWWIIWLNSPRMTLNSLCWNLIHLYMVICWSTWAW